MNFIHECHEFCTLYSYAASWWGPEAGEVLHQLHSQHWASLNRELLEENGKLGDVLFWMRAGGVNSKLHQTMSWAGDQVVEWSRSDGLKSSLVAALSLATGGFGLSHSDVGGYTTIPQLGLVRTKELLLRWAEYSAFTPIMRTHEGNFPQVNHQVILIQVRHFTAQCGTVTRHRCTRTKTPSSSSAA